MDAVQGTTKPVSKIKELYLCNDSKTFQFDNSLPVLPVPSLEQTLERYLYWVKPHLTKEEFLNTQNEVSTFGSGIGKELHKKLLNRAAEKKNWLEDWWLHYAYLTVREPLLPAMNTAGPLALNRDIWPPSVPEALRYGSLFIWTLLDFFVILREQRLKPQSSLKGIRFSMDQFHRLYNTTRIPGNGSDTLFTCFKTKEEGDCPNHVIVLCHGHIWAMNPFDLNGELLTAPELEVQLRHVRETSDILGKGTGLSVLTCDARDNWFENRNYLKNISVRNFKNMDHIESAILVFVLDDSMPEDYDQLCWEGLCGDTANRWADKSFCAILTRNGCGITNNDHTPFDAMVTIMVAHYQHELLMEMGGVWQGTHKVRQLPLPEILCFDIDQKICEAITSVQKLSQSLVENALVCNPIFTDFGKDWIKQQKIHPDAFIQLGMQLAYYRQHGKPAPTYETATTRKFYHGRTETMRSCTQEAVDFAQTMLDSKASMITKRNKLLTATNKHIKLLEECQNNQGVDRHLMGLYLIALESGLEVPSLFVDPAYVKSGGGGNFVLSSSLTGYTPLIGGVAAMVPHGYGVFYGIQPDKIYFFVSSFRDCEETSGPTFCDNLFLSLQEMKAVLSTPISSL